MVGLRTKLVAYFLLLGLLPAAAAYWGLSALATNDQDRRADTRLASEARAALGAYEARADAAAAEAAALARNAGLQRLLQRSDAAGIRRLLASRQGAAVTTAAGTRLGPAPPPLAIVRRTAIRTTTRLVGTVSVFVPIDSALLGSIHTRAGLRRDDTVAILRASKVVAASPPFAGTLAVPPRTASSVTVGGIDYRVVASGRLPDVPQEQLAVISPGAAVGSAEGSTRWRLLALLAGLLGVVGLASYIEGRSIVRTLRGLVTAVQGIGRGNLRERVPVTGRDELSELGRAFNDMAGELQRRIEELDAERARLNAAIDRIGETLASTHDIDQLRQLLVETALEATGGSSAMLTTERGEVFQEGFPAPSDERVELPLVAGANDFGMLTVAAPKLDAKTLEVANSLASQGVIALENARLHEIVAQQANVDGLTGLANRRRLEEALSLELARSRRFGTPLGVVLADLDDFKSINDRFGHATGDAALRAFAHTLRDTLRDVDLAGRWGGEEFLLILPGTDVGGAAHLAERVRESLAAEVVAGPGDAGVRFTSSFGVATNLPGDTPEELVRRADEALYRAKANGKDRIETALRVG